MNTLRAILILLMAGLSASAQSIITTTVTVTNAPQLGDTYTFNASTRTWATNFSTTTIQTNNTIGGSATNLFLHLIANVPSGPVRISMPATNQVAIEGALSQAITASLVTNWGTIAYSTQAVTAAYTLRVPLASEPTATNRSRFASWLVDALLDYPTNSFPGTASVLTNFFNKTNSGQFITGTNTFTGANTFSNSGQSIVGGTVSNVALIGGVITNSGPNVFRGTNTFGTLNVTNLTGVNDARIQGHLYFGENSSSNMTISGTNDILYFSKNTGFRGAFSNIATISGIANQHAFGSGGYVFHYPAGLSGPVWAIYGGLSASNLVIRPLASQTDPTVRLEGKLHANSILSATLNFTNLNTETFYMTNASELSTNPINGGNIQAVSGDWRYRSSGDAAGTNHYLHNRAGEVVGSGTDYSLTTSYAFVDFSGTDPEFNTLPTAGTYLILATVDWEGGNANDDMRFKLYNATAAADIANSEIAIAADGNSADHSNTIQAIVTITTASRIQLYGKNNTGARGTVNSTLTKLSYVRLY